MNLSQSEDLNIETSNVVWRNIAHIYNDYYDKTKANATATMNEYRNIYSTYTLLGTSLSFLADTADYLRFYYENKR